MFLRESWGYSWCLCKTRPHSPWGAEQDGRYSLVDALGDGGHDEEHGFRHLPGRVPVLQRRVKLREGEIGHKRSYKTRMGANTWLPQNPPEQNTPRSPPGRSGPSPGPRPASGTPRSRRSPPGRPPERDEGEQKGESSGKTRFPLSHSQDNKSHFREEIHRFHPSLPKWSCWRGCEGELRTNVMIPSISSEQNHFMMENADNLNGLCVFLL